MGPGITLKVMAGDKFNFRVTSWYKLNGVTPASPWGSIADIVFMMNHTVPAASGSKYGLTELENSGVFAPGAAQFLSDYSSSYNNSRPKAFVNWILFDEQFKYVASSSGAEQVGADQVFTTHIKYDEIISKNGYLYIYVSNETPNISVFFDNLQVTHTRGAMLEETHYYPFGLTMAGISSKALVSGNPENKFKYNGKEEQRKEFSDGTGLDWMDYGARMYDNQVARWVTIDPKAGLYLNLTPYNYVSNNPIVLKDPDGREIVINYVDANGKTQQISIKNLNQINNLKNHKNPFVQNMYKTLNYLRGESTLQKAIGHKSKVFVNEIDPNNKYGQRYINPEKSNDGTNQINYSPILGLATVSNDQLGKPTADQEQGLIQSPAFGFLHEIDHFLEWNKDNGKTYNKNIAIGNIVFDDEEEKRVVVGMEVEAGVNLGEPTRTNHGGVPVIVAGPTSKTKVDDIDRVKEVLRLRELIKNSSEKDTLREKN